MHVKKLATSFALVALITGAIFGARTFAPVLSLGVLYLLAVVPVAVAFGLAYAIGVSVASKPLLSHLRKITADPDAVAAVVMPELIVRGTDRLLHNQRALYPK